MAPKPQEIIAQDDGLVILSIASNNEEAVEITSNRSPFMAAYDLAVEVENSDPIIIEHHQPSAKQRVTAKGRSECIKLMEGRESIADKRKLFEAATTSPTSFHA